MASRFTPSSVARIKAIACEQIAIKVRIDKLRKAHAELSRELHDICGDENLPDPRQEPELFHLLFQAGI